MKTDEEIKKEMEKVKPSFRYRWCESKECYCMGCVNKIGQANLTKNEWLRWKEMQNENE